MDKKGSFGRIFDDDDDDVGPRSVVPSRPRVKLLGLHDGRSQRLDQVVEDLVERLKVELDSDVAKRVEVFATDCEGPGHGGIPGTIQVLAGNGRNLSQVDLVDSRKGLADRIHDVRHVRVTGKRILILKVPGISHGGKLVERVEKVGFRELPKNTSSKLESQNGKGSCCASNEKRLKVASLSCCNVGNFVTVK